MKKISSIGFLFLLVFMSCSKSKESTFLVGTYTDNGTQGINVITINEDNELLLKKVISGIENPSFVIANKAKNIIVAVEEISSGKGGKVTSFAYNSKSASFKKISSQFTLGDHPCSVAFSPDEKHVLVGNYTGGSLTVFPIDTKGNLSESNQIVVYQGKSVNAERQERPHIHSIVFHPKEDKVFVADLGSDVIEMIPFEAKSDQILRSDKTISTKVNAGSGPRHLLFNSDGTLLYVTFELTNQVGIFAYKDSKLELIQTVSLTKTPTKNGSAAELRLSKDGKFLYASVRGNDNHLVMIRLNNGKNAEVIQTIPTGNSPRNFIITKDQKRIMVANQSWNTITVFERDKKTGLLTPTTSELIVNKPAYFYPF